MESKLRTHVGCPTAWVPDTIDLQRLLPRALPEEAKRGGAEGRYQLSGTVGAASAGRILRNASISTSVLNGF